MTVIVTCCNCPFRSNFFTEQSEQAESQLSSCNLTWLGRTKMLWRRSSWRWAGIFWSRLTSTQWTEWTEMLWRCVIECFEICSLSLASHHAGQLASRTKFWMCNWQIVAGNLSVYIRQCCHLGHLRLNPLIAVVGLSSMEPFALHCK